MFVLWLAYGLPHDGRARKVAPLLEQPGFDVLERVQAHQHLPLQLLVLRRRLVRLGGENNLVKLGEAQEHHVCLREPSAIEGFVSGNADTLRWVKQHHRLIKPGLFGAPASNVVAAASELLQSHGGCGAHLHPAAAAGDCASPGV
eukprot:scaffold7730_cov110-Isochrysis_galbana.AAC.1